MDAARTIVPLLAGIPMVLASMPQAQEPSEAGRSECWDPRFPARLGRWSEERVASVGGGSFARGPHENAGARHALGIGSYLGDPAWIGQGDQASVDYGFSVASAGDVNGDGYDDVIVGAREYSNGETEEGRAYVYLGSAAGLSTTAHWMVESDRDFAFLGQAVAGAGDVDGDGYDDVLVSAPWFEPGGRVWLYRGSATGLSTVPAWVYDGEQSGMLLGFSLSSAGDVNGDGYADVLLGAIGFNGPGISDQGRVFLFLGSSTGPGATPDWVADGTQVLESFGSSVAGAGDVNADGFQDVVIGAQAFDNGQDTEGRALLFLGSENGLSPTPAWAREGGQVGAWFGCCVASAGDVDGDGHGDVLVGAFRHDAGQVNEGRAYLFRGSSNGLFNVPSWTAEGDQEDAFFGLSVRSAGDVNADGYSDVIAGASFYETGQTEEGRAFVFMGSPSGLSTAAAWTVDGDQVRAHLGYDVAPAGDVDGDGFSDVLASATEFDDGEPNEGAVFLFAGRSTASHAVRNGDGTNPMGYTAVSEPVIGSPWLVTVDLPASGAIGSFVAIGLGGRIAGPHLTGLFEGQLLVLGPFLVDVAVGAHSIGLPPVPGLFGARLATQAATFAPGAVRLNNAIDATLGY